MSHLSHGNTKPLCHCSFVLGEPFAAASAAPTPAATVSPVPTVDAETISGSITRAGQEPRSRGCCSPHSFVYLKVAGNVAGMEGCLIDSHHK